MRLPYLFTCLLLGTTSVVGQNAPHSQYFSDKSGAIGLNGPVGVFDTQKDIKGTPYLFNEWYQGEITYLNNKKLPVENLRYDLYKNELLVFRSKNEMGILPKNLIRGFKIKPSGHSHPLQYVRADQIPALHRLPADQFLEVLYQSEKIGLYARNWKTFQKADHQATYYTEKLTDEFSDLKQELFLVKKDGSVYDLALRRRTILKTLKVQKAALKVFIRENELSFEDTQDLVKVIQYYEELACSEQF